MRYRALAVDYDGTLATDGHVPDDVVPMLQRLKGSGRKLILVTGRQLDDMRRVFRHTDLFDRMVAENGGVLSGPGGAGERALAAAPPAELIAALERRNVEPLDVGHVVLASCEPHQTAILDAVHKLGLEYQIVFNKGSIMVLPAGVNKQSGLLAALAELGLSPRNVVGMGDAENDHAFLDVCECAVAVANALPVIKKRADFVTRGANSAGVVEVIEALLEDDLARVEPRLEHHHIVLGTQEGPRQPSPLDKAFPRGRGRRAGKYVLLPPFGTGVLIAGTSRAGKSSLVLGLVERIQQAGYQLCLIDPEGDYEAQPNAVNLGNAQQTPTVQDVLDVLDDPTQNVCVSLLAMAAQDRPRYFGELQTALSGFQARSGRPHWLVVDEAHHVLPSDSVDVQPLAWKLGGLALVTLDPKRVAAIVKPLITHVCLVGRDPSDTLAAASELLEVGAPTGRVSDLRKGQALLWRRGTRRAQLVKLIPATYKRRRHRRKYVEGELPPERSFYFRGAENALNLRAQNLQIFVQIATGLDEATWEHHLRAGDYSRWIETQLKDRKLARGVAAIERDHGLSAEASRARVRELIDSRYAPPS
jgi:hydroxymethylpyrimidine pyrophosphatase-like HAD family hydrolase